MQKNIFLFLVLNFFLHNTNTIIYAKHIKIKNPMYIEAKQMFYDDLKQVKIFTGNVKFTCGTLVIKANKAILTTDSVGYELVVLHAASKQLVSFSQKLDKYSNIWIQGQAKRIEYSEKTGISKLFSSANIQRINNTKITDAIHGEFISYNSHNGFYVVSNNTSVHQKIQGNKSITKRITAVIQTTD